MPKYRKKPVVVEAVQYKGGMIPHEKWFWDKVLTGEILVVIPHDPNGGPGHILINTLEGQMRAGSGDYIIKGVKGEVYPCKPEVFEVTYEPVSEPAALTADGGEHG